eukprot:s27_g42.t1
MRVLESFLLVPLLVAKSLDCSGDGCPAVPQAVLLQRQVDGKVLKEGSAEVVERNGSDTHGGDTDGNVFEPRSSAVQEKNDSETHGGDTDGDANVLDHESSEDEAQGQSAESLLADGVFDRRRRRRRRRRQINTLNRKCWYQMWEDENFEGGWLNYEMGNNGCDDLTSYNSGSWNKIMDSGLAGASPGCKISVYESGDCSGTAHVLADATSSSSNAYTKNMNHLSDIGMGDKISSLGCTCP